MFKLSSLFLFGVDKTYTPDYSSLTAGRVTEKKNLYRLLSTQAQLRKTRTDMLEKMLFGALRIKTNVTSIHSVCEL